MNESKKQYIDDIIKKHEAKRKKYDKDYRIGSIKNWLGGLIIIGSTLIPGTALLKIFGGLAKVSPATARIIPLITNIIIKNIKFSKPLLKQIIENTLKKAVLEGGVYGGIYGFGYSIQQDKNFKETVETITDSVINGIIFNVLLSSAVLTGKLTVKGKDILYNFERRKDWGIVFKKASGNPELAIQTLLKYKKGFVPKAIYKKGIGNIDFPWGKHNIFTDKGYGLKHIIARRRNQKIDIRHFLITLLNTLEKGFIIKDKKYIGNYNIEDILNKIAIATNGLNKNRIMPITAHPQNKSAAKRLAILRPMSKPYVDSRSHFTTELHRLIDILRTKNKFVNSRLINILKRLYIYISVETNRTPDIVSNYSEMALSQTTDMKKIINSFDKSAAKRLAAWKPKSKPYVDSRILFTTELHRLIDILRSKNKFVNSRSVNISQKKLKKLLLFLLLNQTINKRKNNTKKINLGFGSVKKGGNVSSGDTTNPEQNSDTPQQTQYYEFIPFEYL